MTGTGQPYQVSLLTEIGGSVKFLIGIVKPFRNQTDNHMDPTIKPTIVHFNQETLMGHSD